MRRMIISAVVAVAMVGSAIVPAAAHERGRHDRTPPVPGLVVTQSTHTFADTLARLTAAIDASSARIVEVVDHAAAAEAVGRELPPTTLVLFGNPDLGTPLMQADQTAGIDLPQKMLVWQERRRVYVAYNSGDYLAARHDIGGVATLGTIAGALASFASAATGVAADDIGAERGWRDDRRLRWIAHHPGLRSITSARPFDATVAALTTAIGAAPPSLVLTLDHQANAARVGRDLRPTTLIVVGSPALGTPLMQRRRTIAIDLPQKFLVHEDADGAVTITWNNPCALARRHQVGGERETLRTIATALRSLATAAAGR